MHYLKRLNEIAELTQTMYPAPIGTYVIYLLDKHFVIKPSKRAGNPECIIIRLPADAINHGINCRQWEHIKQKLYKLNEANLL